MPAKNAKPFKRQGLLREKVALLYGILLSKKLHGGEIVLLFHPLTIRDGWFATSFTHVLAKNAKLF